LEEIKLISAGGQRRECFGANEPSLSQRSRSIAAMAKDLVDELKQAGMQSPERVPDPLRPEALQVFLAAFSRGRSPGTLSEHAARNIQRCYTDDSRAECK
jgi:hypothetical protein